MTTLTLRTVKGSPLTNQEIDDNFSFLNTDKVELGGDLSGNNFAPTVSALFGVSISNTAPSNGQILQYTGNNISWVSSDLSVDANSSSVVITYSTGNNVVLPIANSVSAGLITAETQTITGEKTFSNNVSAPQFVESGVALTDKYTTTETVLALAIALG